MFVLQLNSVIISAHPPAASIVEPKYLNQLEHGIGILAKQTSSLVATGTSASWLFCFHSTRLFTTRVCLYYKCIYQMF